MKFNVLKIAPWFQNFIEKRCENIKIIANIAFDYCRILTLKSNKNKKNRNGFIWENLLKFFEFYNPFIEML